MKDPEALPSDRARLIKSLWQDARREADQLVAKAQTEANKLLEDNVSFREREMALSSERAQMEAKPQVSRILNRARSRARQFLLEGRYAFLSSCFDEALQLAARDDDLREETRSALPCLLAQALSVMGDREHIQVTLNPADMECARLLLEEKGTSFDLIADENICGGAMVKGNDGSIVADNTLEARLGALRKMPPIDLLKMINPD